MNEPTAEPMKRIARSIFIEENLRGGAKDESSYAYDVVRFPLFQSSILYVAWKCSSLSFMSISFARRRVHWKVKSAFSKIERMLLRIMNPSVIHAWDRSSPPRWHRQLINMIFEINVDERETSGTRNAGRLGDDWSELLVYYTRLVTMRLRFLKRERCSHSVRRLCSIVSAASMHIITGSDMSPRGRP